MPQRLLLARSLLLLILRNADIFDPSTGLPLLPGKFLRVVDNQIKLVIKGHVSSMSSLDLSLQLTHLQSFRTCLLGLIFDGLLPLKAISIPCLYVGLRTDRSTVIPQSYYSKLEIWNFPRAWPCPSPWCQFGITTTSGLS